MLKMDLVFDPDNIVPNIIAEQKKNHDVVRALVGGAHRRYPSEGHSHFSCHLCTLNRNHDSNLRPLTPKSIRNILKLTNNPQSITLTNYSISQIIKNG